MTMARIGQFNRRLGVWRTAKNMATGSSCLMANYPDYDWKSNNSIELGYGRRQWRTHKACKIVLEQLDRLTEVYYCRFT
jgi:hypothetical protein